MITEDYVTYEVGLLLREKRFDEICEMFYCKPNEGYKNNIAKREWRNSALREDMVCTCPTVYLAMKWLRVVHNIIVVIEPRTYSYEDEKVIKFTMGIWCGDNYEEYYEGGKYGSYEEACNEAIKYCLEKLI